MAFSAFLFATTNRSKTNKMKTYHTSFVFCFFMMIMASCKKSDADQAKDYSASIIGKTWSGAFTYTKDSTQYYSVHFNADKTLLWTQFSGDKTGNWGLIGKELTITFTGSSELIKASISDNNKFENIAVENMNTYVVNSGMLITDPSIPLEGTTWTGSIFSSGTRYGYQFSFLPGSKVQEKISSTTYPLSSYTRSASGTTIRFTNSGSNIFGVITSANEMSGCLDKPTYPWHIIKQ
jgi:hypothetical protein